MFKNLFIEKSIINIFGGGIAGVKNEFFVMQYSKICEIKNRIKKLNTYEDVYYLHKIFGLIVLSNYLYRFFLLFTKYHMNLQNNTSIILLIFHFLLSFTSLFFKLSNVRNRKIPIIYPEFRLHNIIFALRSVLCCISFYYLQNFGRKTEIVNMFICLLTMKCADKITNYFKYLRDSSVQSVGEDLFFENKVELKLKNNTPESTTMRNMPYDEKMVETKVKNLKKIYSYMQIYATYYMLGNINSAFSPMFAIQISSFLMTLVKKNIIPPMWWHPLYFSALLSNTFVFFTLNPLFIIKMNFACSCFSYWRMKYGYNKYIGWILVFLFHYFLPNTLTFSPERSVINIFGGGIAGFKNEFFGMQCRKIEINIFTECNVEILYYINIFIFLVIIYHYLKYNPF